MELKPGYKQTEVGVIPEDWESRQVRSACKLINGRGFKPYEWRTSGLPIIRIQNLNGSEDFNHFDGHYAKKLEVENGQLLFAWSGSRGTSFGPHIWNGPLGLLNYHTWKMQVDDRVISPQFFLHALKKLTTFIEENAHGASALVHTQKREMESFEFPCPPTLAEQEAIAEALSDADALIDSLEQLIAKKRRVKQGAMQDLLTGKKRLPGFEGVTGYHETEVGTIPDDWEVKSVGEFASIKTGPFGTLLKASEYTEGEGVPVISVGEIRQGFLRISPETPRVCKAVTKRLPQYLLNQGDIVFGRKGGVERSALVLAEQEGWFLGSDGISIRPLNGSQSEFLALQLQSYRVQEWLMRHAIGTTMASLNQSILSRVLVPLPPTETEQSAIAAILSDMDLELAALEAKLAKARQVKQGMMQELLTGKTRLV